MSVTISFYGAAGEVTGSCYLVQTNAPAGGRAPDPGATNRRILIDCGLFQGGPSSELANRRRFPFDPTTLDSVVVTHAHLDHTGRLPKLVGAGAKCAMWCTGPTVPLMDLVLRDAARLSAADCERRARKMKGRGCRDGKGGCCEPLFTEDEVLRLIKQTRVVRHDKAVEICPGVKVRFVDAGHIIGSTSVVLTIGHPATAGPGKVIVFSGDIGHAGTPILRDPIAPKVDQADILVMESTYGDRDHKDSKSTINELAAIVNQASDDGGKILIPSFAIGRTQTLLYDLARLKEAGLISKTIPVIVDSPMAIEATRIYELDRSLFDEETISLLRDGSSPLRFQSLRMSRTGQESRGLNDLKGPAIIIAGAGMCTGGRILHHIAHQGQKSTTKIIFSGFQSEGTLGRQIVNGARRVRIHGVPVDLEASVHTLNGFSAHAGQSELVAWSQEVIGRMASKPELVLTHGENGPRGALAVLMRTKLGVACHMPEFGGTVSV